MELFIQIRNGQPYEHPIFGDNFREAFPHIDTNNLPPEFARFERIPAPITGVYEIVEGPAYEWVDGVVKDVWSVRQMTETERASKTKELTYSANRQKEFFVSVAQQAIQDATTEAARQVWEAYLVELNAWVLVDPETPQIPTPPRVLADGTVVTNNSPGSAPDVTG